MRGEARASKRLAGAALVGLLLAACNPAPTTTVGPGVSASLGASASPSSLPASGGAGWSVADVRQSSDVTDAPSLAPGYFCSPCHAPAQSLLLGLAAGPDRLIAVGVEQPPARPIVYASLDGHAWEPALELPTTGPAAASAVVATSSLTVVVGSAGRGAASWASAVGASWKAAPVQSSLEGPAGGNAAMTAVVALGGQVIAAGYVDDPAAASQSGAVWRSTDGLTWSLDRTAGMFDGARILGLAVRGSTLVAVGTVGDPTYGSSVAWRWTAADGWQQARVAGLDGAMHAVAATANGFVAVGHGPGDDGAAVWTSTDGLAWQAVADQPAFHPSDGAARMLSVAAGPGGLLVGAGRTGYPDNDQATVWINAGG